MKSYRVGNVYSVTNKLNGKRYVGWTIVAVEKRFARHLYDAAHGSDVYFHRALRKWGAANFVIETLHQCTEPLLREAERCFIKQLNTITPHGYNLTLGGDGGGYGHRSYKERKAIGAKIGAANKGKVAAKKIAYYATPEGAACKARIAAKLSGRKLSKRECANHSTGLRIRYASEAEHVKTREASMRHYASLAGVVTRRKQSEAGKRRAASGRYFSDKTLTVLSAKASAQHKRMGHVLHA
jgi:group I intron endonuclease